MGRNAWWMGERYGIVFVCIILIGQGIAFGQTIPSLEPSAHEAPGTPTVESVLTKSTPLFETEFTLRTGVRKDDLDWSIAGNGVDTLSELNWSDVDSYQLSIGNRTRLKNNICLRGQLDYATIIDGGVRDSDYGGNGTTAEFSRSVSETNGDQLWDLSIGGGYAFFFLNRRLTVSPMLGLSYHKQNLRIQNGRQLISEPNPFGGPDPPEVGPLSTQLNSSYFARWFGPWIGGDLRYKLKMQPPVLHEMEFRFAMELHWADYSAEGNWNLRDDLQHPRSFEHEADGFGIHLTAELLIDMADQWDLTVSASHQDWSTGTGTDRKFLSRGGESTTQLNEVNWSSTDFMVGAVYRF